MNMRALLTWWRRTSLLLSVHWNEQSTHPYTKQTNTSPLCFSDECESGIYLHCMNWNIISTAAVTVQQGAEGKNSLLFQELNISCYVNGNKRLKSWHSRIRCSDYNILKCSCENPGLRLVIRRSVSLFHIPHFSLFSFFKLLLRNFLI